MSDYFSICKRNGHVTPSPDGSTSQVEATLSRKQNVPVWLSWYWRKAKSLTVVTQESLYAEDAALLNEILASSDSPLNEANDAKSLKRWI